MIEFIDRERQKERESLCIVVFALKNGKNMYNGYYFKSNQSGHIAYINILFSKVALAIIYNSNSMDEHANMHHILCIYASSSSLD